ncbi:hypothetical protein [Nocardiopsis tropica]|uniref:Uncharacterized protein n=1 Tax=Nocardiopsis tropica TaxID=109330 RepID=A0ABU7KM06_9ACTN|nr:hypothetical protein [Nocardiopsis umidischolae]MEE2050328.1 hypothetical protein [Nocardiopsis umidischolae]
MAWFKVDDRAHSHPKVMAAGTPAYGLWSRCGSYCSEHLTDGIVPKPVARSYGTPAMAKRLVAERLWHVAGHDCPRCAQPPAGDYVMHDYLDYNPGREEVEEEREAARDRMRKRRGFGRSSEDVRPNKEDGKPGKAVTNTHHDTKTNVGTNDSGRSNNFGNPNDPNSEPTGESAGQPDGSENVRANTHRTSDGVRGPRPRPVPGVPSEHSPPTPTGTQHAASVSAQGGGGNLLDLIREQTGATDDQAAAVLTHIRDRHQPRSLSAYVRSMAARDTLRDVLTEMAPAPRRVRPKDEWMTRQ